MAEAFYRLKSAGGAWTRVTGTAPITVTGLTEGAVYEYLKGDGTIGEVTAGVTLTVPAAMSAPSLAGGTEEATLTLATPAPDNGGDTITSYGYEVTDSADTGFASPVASGTQTPGNLGTPINISPLTADDYIARSRATNSIGSGAWSAASAAATVTAAGGDVTDPVFNSSSYDDATDTFTADVSEDATLYYVYDEANVQPSEAQMLAGQGSDGAAAELWGSFAVTTGVNNEVVNTSSLADGTYYLFAMLEDGAGNRSTVTAGEEVIKATPTINYVNQTNDPRLRYNGSVIYDQDYWFFAASLKVTAPELAISGRVYEMGNHQAFYHADNKYLLFKVNSGTSTEIYAASYDVDLSTRKHVAFKYDGITGTPTFWIDGVEQLTTRVTFTSATTGNVPRVTSGLFILDGASANRSLRAEEVSQLVIANADLGIADVWDSGAGSPVVDLSTFTGDVKMGEDYVAADWNAGSNKGTGGALTKDGGVFTDV